MLLDMPQKIINILLIGPCTDRTKGGMATVISGILNDPLLKDRFNIKHIVSHAEDSFFLKLGIALKALVSLLSEHRNANLIHLHVADGASFFRKGIMAVLGRLLGKKVVFHLHAAGFDSFYKSLSFFSKMFAFFIFFCCDRIVVLSDYWKFFLASQGINQNIHVLPNGIDTDFYASCINTDSDFKSFLFLGRLCERKGIYDLLEVIKKIKNNRVTDGIKFYLAGDGDVDVVRDIVKDNNLDDIVQITGWIDLEQKKALLEKVDFVILPSYKEAFPVSLLEGMASGKILISTCIPGVTDMISEGLNGFLTAPGDIDALLDLIQRILDDEFDFKKISRNNLKKAKSLYDSKIIRKYLLEIYTS